MMQDPTAAMGNSLLTLINNLAMETISARVRMRALLDLLEEKSILLPGEYDARGQAVWERDYDELFAEMFAPGAADDGEDR